MSSIPSRDDPSTAALGGSSANQSRDSRARIIQLKWAALQDAAEAVRALAGLEARHLPDEIRDFPEFIQSAGGWRLDHAARAVDDLAAVMEQGLAALLSARTKGANASIAALALWREFEAATAAIVLLAPPPADTTDRPAGDIDNIEAA